MRLAPFIRENASEITSEWEVFAATLVPAADDMSPLGLRNHITQIFDFVAADIEQPQTYSEQIIKSHGKKSREGEHSAAEIHAALRLAGGFNLDQMVSEYRSLRASVIKLWEAQLTAPGPVDISDLTRFNEAVDQILMESIHHYSAKISDAKNLFLAILNHDLRNPFGSAMMSAKLAMEIGPLNGRQTTLVSQVITSSTRGIDIINHLLDLTRARLGSGLPVMRAPMDMGLVSRQLVEEMRVVHPQRQFQLEASGDLQGDWDKARIGQVLANLFGNAVSSGLIKSPIRLTVTGEAEEVTLTMNNDGASIPADAIDTIFDPLTVAASENRPGSVSLGLGLFITKEIVEAHGGTIAVTSSETEGTTFTAHFPRSPQ